ncbi:ATP-binding protein [Paraliobacillus sediminis]|uniref:ATP-binding protein n=1 Tax=Paraliobacillus sediminis TaxID=1885916 RepID=UPI000E3DC1C5|nr:ATP-binding protein [Paraliobacillus sediminis]
MSGYEIDENTDNAVLATFSIANKPAQFSLASLPKEVLNWIEKQGFDFITICNDIGAVIYISYSIEKVLGFDRDDLIESNAISYFSPSDQVRISEKFIKNTIEVQKFTASIRDALGRYKAIDSVIASLISRDTHEKLYISLSKDITDKKEAEQMLIRSEKMSIAGQLAAGVAHEIRNPLTSLKGFVQLLQAGIDRKDEYYKIMIDEIEKIDAISSELLFIAKPMTDERKNENVSDMIQDVMTLLNTQAKVYNINLDSQIEIDHTVYCDRTQIKQVLINLIKNAIEEMPDGGAIKIQVTDDHTYCIISVIDEGPGIPESLLHKLKEPFFTTKKEGTGLGLMISNKIVENHNGKLNISQNQNKGSTFSVLLPRINKKI